MNTSTNTDWISMLLLKKNNKKLFAKYEKHAKPLTELCKIICETVTYCTCLTCEMLEIFSRNDVFFPKNYPSKTPAFWRIKLNQWDFRTRVITTNTSLTIGLQVPNRLNCVTHHLTNLNWNTLAAMITSVKQTSNKARLKQLLTKSNKPVIEVVTSKSTLQKCHES